MGRGDIASLDVFYLWKIVSLIFIFPNDMPAIYMHITNDDVDNKYTAQSTSRVRTVR